MGVSLSADIHAVVKHTVGNIVVMCGKPLPGSTHFAILLLLLLLLQAFRFAYGVYQHGIMFAFTIGCMHKKFEIVKVCMAQMIVKFCENAIYISILNLKHPNIHPYCMPYMAWIYVCGLHSLSSRISHDF